MCGGTDSGLPDADAHGGLSPRVRGNQAAAPVISAWRGSIPACAGEPDGGLETLAAYWVYPRVCGGTVVDVRTLSRRTGLSPRVRGNPAAMQPPIRPPRVYPRVCGGTSYAISRASVDPGLSPRVRGNPPLRPCNPPLSRSIPACAGEPPPGAPCSSRPWVYPRVCGGTLALRAPQRVEVGLSPRVRGNPSPAAAQPTAAATATGSIPACAGEPRLTSSRPGSRPVYPRVCGGTDVPL